MFMGSWGNSLSLIDAAIVTLRMTSGPPPSLDDPPLGLPGIGPARADAYASAGLTTRRALLYHLPNRFRVRPEPLPVAELVPGERGAVQGKVVSSSLRRRGRNSTVSLRMEDAAGDALLVLVFNRAYLAKGLRGKWLWVAGRCEGSENGPPRLLAADYGVVPDETPVGERLLPLYRLPAGVPPATHRKALAALLAEQEFDDWRDPEPGELSLDAALRALHGPETVEQAREARRRLARDEAFALSLQVAARRRGARAPTCTPLKVSDAAHRAILKRLPHTPTAAQSRVLDELRVDLAAGRPMARLLQGDVGSGKTLIAVWLLLACLRAKKQAALMAPTEVLARQHAAELEHLLGVPPVLLVGGQKPAERRAAKAQLATGEPCVVVGTHALANEKLEIPNLAAAVVDEQHKFGVRQRMRFRGQDELSHLLVMTATPIPRTLALTAYGELDVSIIDELPPGRSPRRTLYVPPGKQPALWGELARQIREENARGFVVCPSIASQEEESHSVESTLTRVRDVLGPKVRVAGVHGKLPADQRDTLLDAFRAGDLDVLVATVIIEVGLDVPEASFVVLPDPSRFGLATLHQIRGRVGRGSAPGSCYLLGPLAKSGKARERVEALVNSEDGFRLAEDDLRLRGPGEVLGTRQSGMPGFLVLDPVSDVDLLAITRGEALSQAEGMTGAALRKLGERAFPRVELARENLLAGG
ncbi:MAG: ATP-dependent DNA helicase RecG [Planctomycetota bacterium]|nr:MAG: ATP-dependent DNA helicase RecG [Planctomycetota bacterium]